MTPPEAPRDGSSAQGITPPAVSVCPDVTPQDIPPRIDTMRARADFLAAARALRQGTAAMMIQARPRADGDTLVRVGFTCSKKVGNAVARNRAKRRMRAIARAVLPDHARPGWDYVLIGRAEATAARDFAALQADLVWALRKLHGQA